ncbi:MAG: hypothetical protein RL442_40 [Pseudomonadota bacterium]|jgi:hypothetical protein
MATLPDSTHTTAHQIVRWYESKPQQHRPHMGASLIGHQCRRSVWLTWRWVMKPEFSGRILRLFNRGQREEQLFVEELRGIGATVWDKDPETGDQIRVSACKGHFGGSLDGIAKGLPEAPKSTAVLEFKTHSSKSFADLVKHKVQASKPQHYSQMMVYMGLMVIDRALYMAVNKDTDELYTEWVHFDAGHFNAMMERAEELIEMNVPPVKFSDDPANYVCKQCNFWKHCHGAQAAEANCRTCCHSSPVEDSAWHCQKHDGKPDLKVQADGCNDHLMIPALVPYGEPIDGGQSWVAYKHRDNGVLFVNGPENCSDYGPIFSSKELHNCPSDLIADVINIKQEFPVSKVTSGSVNAPGMDWDSICTHPDDLPVQPDPPAKRAAREKIRSAVKAMEALKK